MGRFAKQTMAAIVALAILLAVSPLVGFAAETKSWSRNADGNYVNNKGEVIVGAVRRGVDVSEYNGSIDWAKAQADDIGYAIIRVGGRYMVNRTFYFDTYFDRNVAECERLGIPYGVYFFSTATTAAEAREEAKFTLNHLKGHNPTMPIYIDMEWEKLASTSNRQLLATVATAFCETIAEAGYEPGVYANTTWFNNYLTDPCFDRWTRWVAQYYYKCEYEGAYDMWQCTSSAKIAGFSNVVDLNMDLRPNWSQEGSWVDEDDGRKYLFDDGTYASGDLVYVNGLVYSFDDNNALRYGWQEISGGWYYFDPDSGAMQRGWLNLDGVWYYLDPAMGKAVTGWATVNGTKYCFDADRKLIYNDWAADGSTWYYMDKNGHITKNAWKTDDATGAKYYLGKDGAAYTNQWLNSGGAYYYFGSDSKAASGWLRISGTWRYFDPETNKLLIDGFATSNGKTYYIGSKGSCVNGWVKANGTWYYFDKSSYAMLVNDWVRYKNSWYHFGEDGAVTVNGLATASGKTYFMGSDGTVKSGWKQVGSAWYHFNTKSYAADTSMWIKALGTWYYLGKDGKVTVEGWASYAGKWYYMGTGGAAVGGWVQYGDAWYYCDPSSLAMVTGTVTIDGKAQTFAADGKWQDPNATEAVSVEASDTVVESDSVEAADSVIAVDGVIADEVVESASVDAVGSVVADGFIDADAEAEAAENAEPEAEAAAEAEVVETDEAA